MSKFVREIENVDLQPSHLPFASAGAETEAATLDLISEVYSQDSNSQADQHCHGTGHPYLLEHHVSLFITRLQKKHRDPDKGIRDQKNLQGILWWLRTDNDTRVSRCATFLDGKLQEINQEQAAVRLTHSLVRVRVRRTVVNEDEVLLPLRAGESAEAAVQRLYGATHVVHPPAGQATVVYGNASQQIDSVDVEDAAGVICTCWVRRLLRDIANVNDTPAWVRRLLRDIANVNDTPAVVRDWIDWWVRENIGVVCEKNLVAVVGWLSASDAMKEEAIRLVSQSDADLILSPVSPLATSS